jgi:hypothetical protein
MLGTMLHGGFVPKVWIRLVEGNRLSRIGEHANHTIPPGENNTNQRGVSFRNQEEMTEEQ